MNNKTGRQLAHNIKITYRRRLHHTGCRWRLRLKYSFSYYAHARVRRVFFLPLFLMDAHTVPLLCCLPLHVNFYCDTKGASRINSRLPALRHSEISESSPLVQCFARVAVKTVPSRIKLRRVTLLDQCKNGIFVLFFCIVTRSR